MIKKSQVALLIILMLFVACTKNTGPVQTTLSGTVKNSLNGEVISPAYIMYDQQLLTTTLEDGTYEIISPDEGTYSLICSALGFSDLPMQVAVESGKGITLDFLLVPDETRGSVLGELHDQVLYQEQLIENPSMAGWTGQELFDGVSGATIESKNFEYDVFPGYIYMGDSLFAITDDYGQYWFDIQCGTYPFMVVINGYIDSLQIARVANDSLAFANFILERE